jgi:hypothetical protein
MFMLDAALIDKSPNKLGWIPATWALAASLVLHLLGLTGVFLGGVRVPDKPDDLQNNPVIEAALLTAQMIEKPNLTLNVAAKAVAPEPTAVLSMQTVAQASSNLPPKPVARLKSDPKPEPKTAKPAKPEPAPIIEAVVPANALEPIKDLPAAAPPALANTESTPPTIPPSASPTLLSQLPPITQLPQFTPLPPLPPVPDITPSASSPNYRLPKQLNVRFEAHARGFIGKSILQWEKTTNGASSKYEAQLSTTATVLFKSFEHRFKSAGMINGAGLAPLNVEEKRTNGSVVATTVEPSNNRVIISSKEGFLPYDPQAHDLVSLMVQLAIYAQVQPQWQQAGTAQDFTVYRPSGIKRWRFQSMGVVNITLGEKPLQTVHIRRVPLGAEPDFEDQFHFWLDLSRYGFPVKIRQIDSKGNVTDISMIDWQES